MTLSSLRPACAGIALAFCALTIASYPADAAQGRPGDRRFATIDSHSPVALDRALKTAADGLASGDIREFRIMLGGRAVLLVIPGSTIVQREAMKIMRAHPQIRVAACKETVDAITKMARQRPPLLPGVRVESCKGRVRDMEAAGWQRVPGL
jgi:hypothetical protein